MPPGRGGHEVFEGEGYCAYLSSILLRTQLCEGKESWFQDSAFGPPSPRKGGSRALTAGRLPEHLPVLRFFFRFLPEATATSDLASYPFLSLEGQAEPSCCLFTVPTLPVLHSLAARDLGAHSACP